MAKRKKSNEVRRREQARQREERRPANRIKAGVRKHPRALITLAICIAVLVGLAVVARNLDFTDYDGCFNADNGPALQNYQVSVYIQIGNATGFLADFIRINNGTGNLRTEDGKAILCRYAIHVPTGDPGTRGLFYTPLIVESPYSASRHSYTLGDFFTVWGYWLHSTDQSQPALGLAFHQGKVSYYTSANIEIRQVQGVNTKTSAPESDPFILSGLWQNTPLQPGYGYYVIVHDPYTNTGDAYN